MITNPFTGRLVRSIPSNCDELANRPFGAAALETDDESQLERVGESAKRFHACPVLAALDS